MLVMFSTMPIFANDIVIISVRTRILFLLGLFFFFFFGRLLFYFCRKKEQEMDRTSDEKNKRLFISSYFCLLIKDHDFSPGRTEQNVNNRELRPIAVKHWILSCLVWLGVSWPRLQPENTHACNCPTPASHLGGICERKTSRVPGD